jgi:hypothetical protein
MLLGRLTRLFLTALDSAASRLSPIAPSLRVRDRRRSVSISRLCQKCGMAAKPQVGFLECAQMLARPAGPAKSSVFHNFARRGRRRRPIDGLRLNQTDSRLAAATLPIPRLLHRHELVPPRPPAPASWDGPRSSGGLRALQLDPGSGRVVPMTRVGRSARRAASPPGQGAAASSGPPAALTTVDGMKLERAETVR